MNQVATKRLNLQSVLRAAALVQAEVEAKLEAIGLSGAKLVALRAISEAGESVPLTQLAGRLSCVKSNITQCVDRLEADGLVSRESDPDDRRTKLAVLTPAGRKAVKEGSRVFEAAEHQVLARLTHEEAELLSRLLGKIQSGDR